MQSVSRVDKDGGSDIIRNRFRKAMITISLFSIFNINKFQWLQFYFLLPSWIFLVMVNACPVRPLIKPCMCFEITKGLEIVCEGVQLEALKDVFENLQTTGRTIMYLKMKNNHIRTFPSNLLNNISVRHLMIHKCNMENVEQFAFFALRDTIESLDMSQNKFDKIPEALKGLSSLVSLNLNYNQIETIESYSFDGMVSLLRLSLFGNKIVSLDPQAFLGIGLNLTRINLGGNQLSSIPSHALRNLSSIQRLQLHENKIHSLSKTELDTLENLEHLDVLNLANNSIRKLEADIFFGLKALNSLDLELNQINFIDNMAFNGVQDTLEWLKLDSNQLQQIPSDSLRQLTKLRELDLKNNFIREIPKESFEDFGGNLKFLYLQKNRIDNIENQAFDKLVSLEWLHLNSNRLKHAPKHWFEKVLDKNLTILDLHDNPLICSCEVLWYKQWIEQHDDNQMAHVWKETKCYYQESSNQEQQKQQQQSKSTLQQNREIFLNDLPSMISCRGFTIHILRGLNLTLLLILLSLISQSSINIIFKF